MRGILPMSHYSRILRDRPTAYYRLGEASGLVAKDSSGNGNAGTINNAGVSYGSPGAIVGDTNTGLTLSSNSGYVATPLTSGGLSAISVVCWIKPTSLPLSTSSRIFADAHTDATNTGMQFLMN